MHKESDIGSLNVTKLESLLSNFALENDDIKEQVFTAIEKLGKMKPLKEQNNKYRFYDLIPKGKLLMRNEKEESCFVNDENSFSPTKTVGSRKEVNELETNMNNTTSINQDSEIFCTVTEPNPVSLLEWVKNEI